MKKPQQMETYQVAPGRLVIPPRSMMPGPGGRALRIKAGAELDLPAGKLDRFWRNRIRLGDLVKVAPSLTPASAAKKEG